MSEKVHLSIPVGPDDHSRGPLDAKLTVVEYGLYENQRDLSDASIRRYVEGVGADVGAATKAIADGGPRQRVEADFEGAIRSGANGTPTFFVNGVRYDGSWMYEPFSEYLSELLDD